MSSESTRMFAELVASLLASRFGAIATADRSERARANKVCVDTLSNGSGRTIVAPYSARSFRGATVSTPLFWDEVSGALDPRRFTIATVAERVQRLGDPMRGLLGDTPGVRSALEKLAALAGIA